MIAAGSVPAEEPVTHNGAVVPAIGLALPSGRRAQPRGYTQGALCYLVHPSGPHQRPDNTHAYLGTGRAR